MRRVLPCISRFRPAILASLIILAFLLGFPGQGEAKGLPIFVNEEVPPKVALPLYVPDEIVAKFKPEIADDTIEAFLKTKGLLEKYKSKLGEFRVLRIPTGKSVPELVEIFRASPLVEYAEPNYYAYAAWTPNDPYYQYQWHLDNAEYGGIEIEEAWDIETGYSRVIVAVIDTGIAYEDLPGPGFWHLDTYNAYGESGHSWWCGVSEALSSWTALYGTDPAPPGYGNGWKQYLQHSFNLTAATGTVTFSYQIRYHTKLNYDYVYVEVSSDGGGSWDELKSYTGPRLPKFVKWTADSVDLTDYKGSNILLRFRFNSDEVYSDEDGDFDSDGAVYIDEVKLEDGSGVIFYDDAESGAGAWEVTQYQKAPDLAGTSFWVNPGEIAGDGIDNDNNGYVEHTLRWSGRWELPKLRF